MASEQSSGQDESEEISAGTSSAACLPACLLFDVGLALPKNGARPNYSEDTHNL